MYRSKSSLTAALSNELNAMRDERLAQARATKAVRHAEALARARALDDARNAAQAAREATAPERNVHVDPIFRGFLNAISPRVK